MITPGLSLIWSQLSKPVTTVGRQCCLTVYSLPCVSAETLKQLDFLCIPEQQLPSLASIWASRSINSSEKGSNVRLSHNSIKPGHQQRLTGNHVYITFFLQKTTLWKSKHHQTSPFHLLLWRPPFCGNANKRIISLCIDFDLIKNVSSGEILFSHCQQSGIKWMKMSGKNRFSLHGLASQQALSKQNIRWEKYT